MKHPFAKPVELSSVKELSDLETEIVGGGLRPGVTPPVTTLAIGEEGGLPIFRPIYTTLAIGEEGGSGLASF